MYKEVLENEKTNPQRFYYPIAVCYSKLQQPSNAIRYLNKYLSITPDDQYYTNTRFNPDFREISLSQEWFNFLDIALGDFNRESKNIEFPNIRIELLKLWEDDQKYRRMIFSVFQGRPPNSLADATEAVDRYNLERLESIVDQIGWPTFEKVGKDGAHAAWNIVQHGIFNPLFMKRCLQEMEKSLVKGQVDGVDFAYLFDRFQSIFSLGQQKYGIVRGVPIFEEYNIEARRKKIGFKKPMEAYRKNYTIISREEYQKQQLQLSSEYTNHILKAKSFISLGKEKDAINEYAKAIRCNGYVKNSDIYDFAKLLAKYNTSNSRLNSIKMLRVLVAREDKRITTLNDDLSFEN
ncbi:MAG: DUF6624 domain-containing protein, partial [Bacteroidota bacterium]